MGAGSAPSLTVSLFLRGNLRLVTQQHTRKRVAPGDQPDHKHGYLQLVSE